MASAKGMGVSRWPGLAVLAWVLSAAGAVAAAPSVEIRHAAARVVVIPEPRRDVAIAVLPSRRLPLRVSHFVGRSYVDGNVNRRVKGCRMVAGKPVVSITGLGDVAYADLPEVVIHTPMEVKLTVGEAVFGSIGRSDSLVLANAGCGDWTIANVTGRMEISQTGSGDTRTGTAGSALLRISGSGDIATKALRGGLQAVSTGSGGIRVSQVDGPLDIKVVGAGDVRAQDGQVGAMKVSIAGAGGVEFGGVAQSLDASIIGSGGVRVARVTGPVTRHLLGAGAVHIGP
ncbi:GIN domain-containing protein [Caulobacter sp. KR2-114]|uniref:GIN domain-containing protein n=1 Tax=Caulobacter sp. KR2-114 TaxID=3400912 RepID=UPI003C0122F4